VAEGRGVRARPGIGLPIFTWVWIGLVVILPLGALALGVFADIASTWTNLTAPEALTALSRTVSLALIALVVNVVLGVLTALVLVRDRFFGRRMLGWLTDLPLAMSPVTIGLAFFVLFGRTGWLKPATEAIGLEVVFAWPGLVMVTLFISMPFVIRETSLLLEELGTSEEEAAMTLGADALQTFWRVTLPNVLPAVASGAALVVARALGEFGAVLVIGGAISGQTDTATTTIYHAVEERQLASAYGLSLVLVALSIAALAAFNSLRKRIHA
jgi:sulfate transport system permease protein